jgi:hypothetical protein
MIKQPGQALPERIQYRLCSKMGLPKVGMTMLISFSIGLDAKSMVRMELVEAHSGLSVVLFKVFISPEKYK